MTAQLSPDQRALVRKHLEIARLVAWEYRGRAPRDVLRSEAYLHLCRAALHWQRRAPFGAFARMLIRQGVRRSLSYRSRMDTALEMTTVDPGLLGWIPSREPEPHRLLERAEEAARVHAALAQLTPRNQAMARAWMDGASIPEIARQQGVVGMTCYRRWWRVLGRLREILSRPGPGPGRTAPRAPASASSPRAAAWPATGR